MLFIPYPCFLSESFLIEMKFPPIILGGTAHEFTHLINVVNKYHGSHIEQFDENEFTISIMLMI